jgi:hypothetical protein
MIPHPTGPSRPGWHHPILYTSTLPVSVCRLIPADRLAAPCSPHQALSCPPGPSFTTAPPPTCYDLRRALLQWPQLWQVSAVVAPTPPCWSTVHSGPYTPIPLLSSLPPHHSVHSIRFTSIHPFSLFQLHHCFLSIIYKQQGKYEEWLSYFDHILCNCYARRTRSSSGLIRLKGGAHKETLRPWITKY